MTINDGFRVQAAELFQALQNRGQGVEGEPWSWIDGIAEAIRAAVVLEREACANLCDEVVRICKWHHKEVMVNGTESAVAEAKALAAAIRARGQTSEGL
jgi:hypothetical protein